MRNGFTIIGALLVLIAGIVLILLHGTMPAANIILVVGLVFLVPSVINVLVYLYQHHESDKEVIKRIKGEDVPEKKRSGNTFTLVASVGAIILGLILIIFSSNFVGLLAFIFGLTLALFGIFHFVVMFINYRKIHFSPLLYLLPVVLIGLAVTCFLLTPGMDHSILILLAGIGLVVFSITIFVEQGYKFAHRRQLKRQILDEERRLQEIAEGKSSSSSTSSSNAQAQPVRPLPEDTSSSDSDPNGSLS